MPENNSSKVKTQNDVLLDNSAISSNITAIRLQLEEIKRALWILQRNKQAFESELTLVKTKLFNNLGVKDVEALRADSMMTVNPTQAMAFKADGFFAPDQTFLFNKNRVEDNAGILPFKMAVDRITDKINRTQAEIRDKTAELNRLNEKIAQNDKKGSGITTEAMETDRIARSRYTSLFYLKQMSDSYRADTTVIGVLSNVAREVRKWPEGDISKSQGLTLLRQLFKAHAMSFPELFASDPKLNLADPGAAENIIIIDAAITAAANGQKTNVIDENVKKYADAQIALLMNRTKSNIILKKDVAVPPAGNSMAEYNKTYPQAMTKLWGSTYNATWTHKSLKDSVLSGLRKRYAGTYKGLPACNPAPLSETDKRTAEARAAQIKAEKNYASKVVAEPVDLLKSFQGDIAAIRKTIAEKPGKGTHISGGVSIHIFPSPRQPALAFNQYEVTVYNMIRKLREAFDSDGDLNSQGKAAIIIQLLTEVASG